MSRRAVLVGVVLVLGLSVGAALLGAGTLPSSPFGRSCSIRRLS